MTYIIIVVKLSKIINNKRSSNAILYNAVPYGKLNVLFWLRFVIPGVAQIVNRTDGRPFDDCDDQLFEVTNVAESRHLGNLYTRRIFAAWVKYCHPLRCSALARIHNYCLQCKLFI